ncbi:MAG TPA: hypothetical protein VNR87_07090 [Flavisolibacter sp.]|nr:hypothetical protein [Flavisolibacter sp.]
MLPATRSSNDPSPSLMSGTWTISSYAQRTEDKTSSFTGYSFLFKSGGVLEAWVNGTATAASWTYTPAAVTYYGTNSSNASVTISFGPAALNRLNRRWNIDSVHTSAARLALVNPEPRDNEHLDFSKQ